MGESDEIVPVAEKDSQVLLSDSQEATAALKDSIVKQHGPEAGGESIAPRDDLSKVLDQLLTLSEPDATDILLKALEDHRGK